MHGYLGRLLHVDLTAGTLREAALDPQLARRYLGGSGLAAALLARRESAERPVAEMDPLGPENPLVWMTGPLVGTPMPSAGRLSLCALSPLTGIWGEANTGGFLGPELRFAGYDGIVFVGAADRPVWLSIVHGEAELHDASALVGLDSYATQQAVRQELADEKARVGCIGLAGENRVPYAAVMNDHGRAAGRCGLGAVMGSKNLKAVAVRGSGAVPVADAEAMDRVAAAVAEHSREDIACQAIRMAGTAGYLDMAMMYGDLPIRSFQRGEWDGAARLSGVRMSEEFLVRGRACYRCPIACGRETRAPRFGLDRVDGPEYETLGALGSILEVDDLEAVIHANHLCNAHGLDTISTGVTIGLACELAEKGLLPEDTEGIDIRYGNAAMLAPLIERIARRQGIGGQLAQGSAALAEAYGVPELAATVHRLEIPMHDPRAFAGMAVTYALSPRGACHMQGDMYSVDTGQVAIEELGITPGDRFDASETKGRIAARKMIWRSVTNALTLCHFQNPGLSLVLDGLRAATGWDIPVEELMTIGRRILTLKRRINGTRDGFVPSPTLPEALTRSLDGGGTLAHVPDVGAMLSGAYDELGWDRSDGMPTPETLSDLGLEEVLECR